MTDTKCTTDTTDHRTQDELLAYDLWHVLAPMTSRHPPTAAEVVARARELLARTMPSVEELHEWLGEFLGRQSPSSSQLGMEDMVAFAEFALKRSPSTAPSTDIEEARREGRREALADVMDAHWRERTTTGGAWDSEDSRLFHEMLIEMRDACAPSPASQPAPQPIAYECATCGRPKGETRIGAGCPKCGGRAWRVPPRAPQPEAAPAVVETPDVAEAERWLRDKVSEPNSIGRHTLTIVREVDRLRADLAAKDAELAELRGKYRDLLARADKLTADALEAENLAEKSVAALAASATEDAGVPLWFRR